MYYLLITYPPVPSYPPDIKIFSTKEDRDDFIKSVSHYMNVVNDSVVVLQVTGDSEIERTNTIYINERMV